MLASTLPGIAELRMDEAEQLNGGDFGASVALGIAIASAMGAGFVWGYNTLGPILNQYF